MGALNLFFLSFVLWDIISSFVFLYDYFFWSRVSGGEGRERVVRFFLLDCSFLLWVLFLLGADVGLDRPQMRNGGLPECFDWGCLVLVR